MRNLGAMGALLVIFVGSFYMGKATSDQIQTGTKVTNNESFKKEEKINPFKGEAFKGERKGQKEKSRGPQSVSHEELRKERILKISDFINKGPYKKMAELMKLSPEQKEGNFLLRLIIALEADSISHEDFEE